MPRWRVCSGSVCAAASRWKGDVGPALPRSCGCEAPAPASPARARPWPTSRPAAAAPAAGLMAALAALLLDCSRHDLASFTADLSTAEAALRCAVAAGGVAAARGSSPQRAALWGDLLPAAFKAIRKLGERPLLLLLLPGEGWRGGGTEGGLPGGVACLPACLPGTSGPSAAEDAVACPERRSPLPPPRLPPCPAPPLPLPCLPATRGRRHGRARAAGGRALAVCSGVRRAAGPGPVGHRELAAGCQPQRRPGAAGSTGSGPRRRHAGAPAGMVRPVAAAAAPLPLPRPPPPLAGCCCCRGRRRCCCCCASRLPNSSRQRGRVKYRLPAAAAACARPVAAADGPRAPRPAPAVPPAAATASASPRSRPQMRRRRRSSQRCGLVGLCAGPLGHIKTASRPGRRNLFRSLDQRQPWGQGCEAARAARPRLHPRCRRRRCRYWAGCPSRCSCSACCCSTVGRWRRFWMMGG